MTEDKYCLRTSEEALVNYKRIKSYEQRSTGIRTVINRDEYCKDE